MQSDKTHLTSILIPVYNEELILEKNVLRLHDYLSKLEIKHEIIVTSNGSTDKTISIGERLASNHSWFHFFHLPEKSVGKAFANGVKQAQGEFIVCQDADLSSDIEFILHAIGLLEYSDMVIGSKSFGHQRRTLLRILGSQVYILITQVWLHLAITDFSMGAKAFRRSSVLPIVDYIDHWTGYILEIYLYLRQKGMRIVQIGVDCNDERKSRFNIIHEGFYRYRHLYRCFKKLKDPKSWYHLV